MALEKLKYKLSKHSFLGKIIISDGKMSKSSSITFDFSGYSDLSSSLFNI